MRFYQASPCRGISAASLRHMPVAIALRVTARRIAVVRQEHAARSRWLVVGHLDRIKAVTGADLPPALLARHQ